MRLSPSSVWKKPKLLDQFSTPSTFYCCLDPLSLIFQVLPRLPLLAVVPCPRSFQCFHLFHFLLMSQSHVPDVSGASTSSTSSISHSD